MKVGKPIKNVWQTNQGAMTPSSVVAMEASNEAMHLLTVSHKEAEGNQLDRKAALVTQVTMTTYRSKIKQAKRVSPKGLTFLLFN